MAIDIVKIEGNYQEVTDALGLVDSLSLTPDERTLRADLSRTPYFSPVHTSDGIKKHIETIMIGKEVPYTQGDLTGGPFNVFYWLLNHTDQYTNTKASLDSLDSLGPNKLSHDLRLCYVNDQGVVCGVVVEYMLNGADTRYCISIINNVTGQPEERRVSYFTDQTLLTDETKEKVPASTGPIADVRSAIKEALQSKALGYLFEGLINKDNTLSVSHFNALHAYVKPNENMDITSAYSNLYRPRSPDQSNSNKALMVCIGSFVAFIALALTVTGVLAPLGIALAAGAASVMGAIGLGVTGALCVGSAVKAGYDEWKFIGKKRQYAADLLDYNSKVSDFASRSISEYRAPTTEETHPHTIRGSLSRENTATVVAPVTPGEGLQQQNLYNKVDDDYDHGNDHTQANAPR